MKTPYRIGTKVYLRPLEKEDAATVQVWVNDPEVTRHLLVYRPMSLLAEEEFIANRSRDEHGIGVMIVARESDRPVGATGLHAIDARHRTARFGILIGEKDCWGRGYGTEATRLMVDLAFATLNLNRVALEVVASHDRACRCYERVGFRREGLLRQGYFGEGRYWDLIVMGLLREEWQQVQGEDRGSRIEDRGSTSPGRRLALSPGGACCDSPGRQPWDPDRQGTISPGGAQ
jgi:RimJ/RimL family protein N-acetyltransferase